MSIKLGRIDWRKTEDELPPEELYVLTCTVDAAGKMHECRVAYLHSRYWYAAYTGEELGEAHSLDYFAYIQPPNFKWNDEHRPHSRPQPTVDRGGRPGLGG